MAFNKKIWKDRLVEYAGRRQLKRISGDSNGTMVVEVTRAEGTISQAGDAFSAANMNDLEQRIGDEFDELNNDLGGLSFYEDSDGNKYVVGADAVPKKLGSGVDISKALYFNAKGGDSSAASKTISKSTDQLDKGKYLIVAIINWTSNGITGGGLPANFTVSGGTIIERNNFACLVDIPTSGTITVSATNGFYIWLNFNVYPL